MPLFFQIVLSFGTRWNQTRSISVFLLFIPFEILTKRDYEEEDALTRIQLKDLVGLENPIIHYTDGRPKIPYVQKNISQSLEPFIFIDDAPTQEHLSYRWEASFYGSEKVDPTIKVYKVPQKDWIFGSAL